MGTRPTRDYWLFAASHTFYVPFTVVPQLHNPTSEENSGNIGRSCKCRRCGDVKYNMGPKIAGKPLIAFSI